MDRALDYGISEFDFWNMTIAEVNRKIKSCMRVEKLETQDKATFDYILAKLIVKGVSITLGAEDSFPSIYEVYPGLFKEKQEEQKQKLEEQKTTLSVLRFKQFAQSHNKKFKEEVQINK